MKTEVEAAWLSRVHAYSYERLTIDGATADVASEYTFHTTKLSVAQVYQFGRNAWVHPFIGAGADVDWLRTAENRPAPGRSVYFVNGQTKTIPVVHEADKAVLFHPFVKTGFKWYLSERASFISEWKFGSTRGFNMRSGNPGSASTSDGRAASGAGRRGPRKRAARSGARGPATNKRRDV